jgi:hypothetical protein
MEVLRPTATRLAPLGCKANSLRRLTGSGLVPDSIGAQPGKIVFCHWGPPQAYVIAAVIQARKSNPSSEVVLLTDQGDVANWAATNNISVVDIGDFSQTARCFEEIYVHEGSNPYLYELRCFQRWMILEEFIRGTGHSSTFAYLDSDAYIFVDYRWVLNQVEAEMTICRRLGPQFVFFKNQQVLVRYVNFIFAHFQDRSLIRDLRKFVAGARSAGVPHVSDMATIGLFASDEPLEDIADASRAAFCFDENIAFAHGFRTGPLGKKLARFKRQWKFIRSDGSTVLAGGVHLQGKNKRLWPLFVFPAVHIALLTAEPRQLVQEWKIFFQFLLPTLAKGLVRRPVDGARDSKRSGGSR